MGHHPSFIGVCLYKFANRVFTLNKNILSESHQYVEGRVLCSSFLNFSYEDSAMEINCEKPEIINYLSGDVVNNDRLHEQRSGESCTYNSY